MHVLGLKLSSQNNMVQDAMRAPRETVMYLPAIIPDQSSRPDYLVTVDVDPASQTFSQVLEHSSAACHTYTHREVRPPNIPECLQIIHRLPMLHIGDELHHSGTLITQSCFSPVQNALHLANVFRLNKPLHASRKHSMQSECNVVCQQPVTTQDSLYLILTCTA